MATSKRPRSDEDEDEEFSVDEPSALERPPTKRPRGSADPPSFMPRPNESFFAQQDPLNMTQQQTASSNWDPMDVDRDRARKEVHLYEEKRTFDSLMQEMERDFDEKISKKVREHPLYDYSVMVIGALGRGNQQINPNLVFDTQEAKQLAESIVSNMKLAMEIKLDLKRQHTLVFENKQFEENKIISKYQSLEKDERFYQRCIAYLSRMLDIDTPLPSESSVSDKMFHTILGIDIVSTFESLASYQSYVKKIKAIDAAMDAYYNKTQSEVTKKSAEWKERTALGRIEAAINGPYDPRQGSAIPPTLWIKAVVEQLSPEERDVVNSAIKARIDTLARRKSNDGFEQSYQITFIMMYMALPQLLLSSGLSGSSFDAHTRLNIELFCDIVHKTLSTGALSAGKIDDYNSVLLKLTGKTYFLPESTEISMAADKDAGSRKLDIKRLTLINDVDITDIKFHKTRVVNLAIELVEAVLSIGVDKGLNTTAKLSQLLKGFTSQLANIDNAYTDPNLRLEPDDIVERRLKISQYYIAIQFVRPLLTWSYPFISDGTSLLDHAATSPDTVSERINRTSASYLIDIAKPLISESPSKEFFDATDQGKGNLANFVPNVVNFKSEDDVINKELQQVRALIRAATMEAIGRGEIKKTDLIDINSLEDSSALLEIEGLEDVRSILVFYDKLHIWLQGKLELFSAQLVNTRQRSQQVKNDAKRMRIFLGAEGEVRPRTDQTEEETQAEKIIDDAFDERSKKMQTAIGAAMVGLEQGDGIKVRSDINYGSERAFSELTKLNPAWARQVGSWQRIGQSRNNQARVLLSNAAASIINESQVVSGTRGTYLQLDIRTYNIVNSAYALQSLLQIPAYLI